MLNDIQIGPITIHMYGLMIGIGFAAAYFICCLRARKKNLSEDILWGILHCSIGGAIIGARLLFYIVSIPQILKDPSILWNFKNGYVVYGGLIFGVLFSYLYCIKKNVSFLQYFDLVMPSVSVAQGFGRIGCFFAGCCYGRETDSAFSIQYWQSDYAPNGVKLIPTQIYSSIGDFAMAFLLMAYAKRNPQKGKVSAVYCILYSIGRFIIEMLRNDYRGTFGFLSTSQLISVFILILGIGMFLWTGKHSGKDEEEWTGI